jgi:protoporphyrinogen oxidase
MSTERKKRVVVLGAGVTGLSTAYRLSRKAGFEVDVVDKELEAGGVCRSFKEGEFILDHGPHKFYTLLDGVLDELKSVMGDELLERDKSQTLYLNGKYFQFPLKMSEMVLRFPPFKSARILMSFAAQIFKNKLRPKIARTYEDFVVERFGRGLYSEIFEPMTRKIFGNPELLDRRLAEVRISSPGLVSVIKQALFSKVDRKLSAPVFHYPKLGFGRIPERFQAAAEKNGVRFHMGSRLLKIEVTDGKPSAVVIENKNGETVRLPADYIVYTIPLTALDKLLMAELPQRLRTAIQSVSYRHSVIYYFLLKSKPVLPSMWVFVPEKRFRFGRLSEMTKFSPFTAPPGYTSLMVDYTCEENDPFWKMDDAKLGAAIYDQLKEFNLFTKDQIVGQFSRRFRNFYPIYNLGYAENLKTIRELEQMFDNLFFIGRLGDFNYNNSDQCLDMGFRAADHLESVGRVGRDWHELRDRTFDQYRIVD